MFKHIILVIAASLIVFNDQTSCRDLLRPSPRFDVDRVVRLVRQVEPQPQPQPFSFEYSTQDENGTQTVRQESGDGTGKIQGSYSYQDPITGLYRVVSYVADENGFNARIETNEPGTKTSSPANAEYISAAQRRR